MREVLSERLRGPLPGRVGQSRFSPELGFGRHFGPPSWDARQGAVLALFYPDADGRQGLLEREFLEPGLHGVNPAAARWRCPLIVRPSDMPVHAGQVCFPGGEIEPGESCEQAAVREFREELGAADAELTILGRLSPLYVFASNFWVTPVVAVTAARPDFRPNAGEVAELLEPTWAELASADRHERRAIPRFGTSFEAPGIRLGERFLWGATAMMLGELFALLGHAAA